MAVYDHALFCGGTQCDKPPQEQQNDQLTGGCPRQVLEQEGWPGRPEQQVVAARSPASRPDSDTCGVTPRTVGLLPNDRHGGRRAGWPARPAPAASSPRPTQAEVSAP